MNKFLAFLIVATLFFPAPARADWYIDRTGELTHLTGSVLGDEAEADLTTSDEPVAVIGDDTAVPTTQKLDHQPERKLQELRKHEQERINLGKIIDRNIKKDVTRSQYELKNKAGILELKGEIKDLKGREIGKPSETIPGGEPVFIEQVTQDGSVDRIKVKAIKDGRLELMKNKIKTSSNLELKVGEKNEISVTLPNGNVREVALPDKALERLVANGVITATEGEGNEYTLTAGKNGDPVYEVEGQVEKKLFGLFKLKFAQKMAVAAGASEDGSVVAGDVVETENANVTRHGPTMLFAGIQCANCQNIVSAKHRFDFAVGQQLLHHLAAICMGIVVGK